MRFYWFTCGDEAGNRERLRLSRRTLENRRKLQRTERIDCAIADRMDTLCKDRAGKAHVADLSANQGPPSQAGTVPFQVYEDRLGGSAITVPRGQEEHKNSAMNGNWVSIHSRSEELGVLSRGSTSSRHAAMRHLSHSSWHQSIRSEVVAAWEQRKPHEQPHGNEPGSRRGCVEQAA